MSKFFMRGDDLMKHLSGTEADKVGLSLVVASKDEQVAFDYGRWMGRKEALDSIFIHLQGLVLSDFSGGKE